MKRIGILLVVLAFLGMLSFSSCKQDTTGTETTEEEMAPAEEEMAAEEDTMEQAEEEAGEY